jgi:hypothetical protein
MSGKSRVNNQLPMNRQLKSRNGYLPAKSDYLFEDAAWALLSLFTSLDL